MIPSDTVDIRSAEIPLSDGAEPTPGLRALVADITVACGGSVARFAHDPPAGDAVFSHAGLEQIHQLGNGDTEPAISIHVYGVDGERAGSHVNRLVETDNQEATAQ